LWTDAVLLQVYSPVYVASVQQKLPKPKPLDMFNDPDKYQARTERLSVRTERAHRRGALRRWRPVTARTGRSSS
jgi:hypothetical protein